MLGIIIQIDGKGEGRDLNQQKVSVPIFNTYILSILARKVAHFYHLHWTVPRPSKILNNTVLYPTVYRKANRKDSINELIDPSLSVLDSPSDSFHFYAHTHTHTERERVREREREIMFFDTGQ